jgi:hypothetical protein
MPFIGNQPALSYTSFAKQDFTTSATTSYTLDNPVANANELALFINFVRQEPTTAYSASGTSLTLTSATSASDDMYCVFLGKAVQTVNPPNASVGTSQLVDGAVTEGKLSALANPFASQLLHIQDQKAYNAHGGSNVVGDQTRDLNTVITNEITGASLSSNQITLPAGTYYIQASAPVHDGSRHRIFLYNVTDSNIDILGTNEYITSAAGQTRSFINQRFTIATEKTFEIKHYTAIVQATNGLGINDDGGGRTSIYTNVEIWRTA